MPFLRLQRLTLGLIAFLAVGWAQTFGLHRGWLCDCGGVEQITQVDHCHGPHSTACHEEEDHSTPHQHDEGDDGETHQHAVVVDSLVAKQQNDAGLSLAAPVQWVEAVCLWESVLRAASVARPIMETPPQRSWAGREWPRRLAQVIALRI